MLTTAVNTNNKVGLITTWSSFPKKSDIRLHGQGQGQGPCLVMQSGLLLTASPSFQKPHENKEVTEAH